MARCITPAPDKAGLPFSYRSLPMARVLPAIRRIEKAALDLLFPHWCIGCGREGTCLCVSCRESFTAIKPPVCPRCGRPTYDPPSCPDCSNWPENIDGVRAPFFFDGLLREAIHHFKYRSLKALAPELAGMLSTYLLDNPLPGECLVPVPLHRKRLRERGYNQSALLARELSRNSGIPVIEDCLQRAGNTPPQARSPSREERHRNVAGAFRCTDDRLRGKRVVLIDDVSTSGATLNAAAAVLKSAGAESVWGLVLALDL